MDSRCPRNLNKYPDSWCQLAVLRLKMLRNTNRESTEEDENNMVGCNWAISCQSANYCFFMFADQFLNDKSVSDQDIANMLNISVDTVKKIFRDSINKMRKDKSIEEISSLHDGEEIINEKNETIW